MKKYDELSNKEKHNFEEFLILTFEFSDDELAAIDKQKPMTMELFLHAWLNVWSMDFINSLKGCWMSIRNYQIST